MMFGVFSLGCLGCCGSQRLTWGRVRVRGSMESERTGISTWSE